MSNYTVYGKSGTSDWQNEGAQYGIPAGTAKDEWSLGYTNKYTIACWSGYTTEYIQQGYYITIYDLNVATAFHISHYMLDYMQKYATYSAIERPSGISDYKGGYIKDEFKSKGDTASENADEQEACVADGGEWDEEAGTCKKADDEEKEACVADGGTWDGTTCKKEDTETNDAETTCVNNGGTWDGSACTYPTTPDPEPTPTQILKIQQDMSGMIEEVYITYLIDFSKSAQLSTFFVYKKNRDNHFPVSSIVFAI